MIERIDHIVLTVRSLEATCRFYEGVLGFGRVAEPGKPMALTSGMQKINLHEVDHTFEPKASAPTPGSADFCLVTSWALEDVQSRLAASGIAIELGPVNRQGARGPMTSVYFRDPDGNLVEVSRYELA